MDPARAFRFPAVRTPSSVTTSSAGSSPSSPTFPITPGMEVEPVPRSPTLSTISTLVARKSFGADSVAGIIRRKISSTVLRPSLPGNHSVDWTMSTSPPTTTGISASRSCSGLVKTQNDTRRRRGIARSVTGSITRFFHLDGEDDENEDGWDFICCGEAPRRPERRAGWLGTLDFEEEAINHAPTNFSAPLATPITASPDAMSALGSPWSPDNKWGEALNPTAASLHPGGSTTPPALASPGWSPASGEGPLLSPSSLSSFRGHYFGLPSSPLPSLEAVHAMYSTPPPRLPSKRFAV